MPADNDTDMALVREYAASHSEHAFAQLVTRHLDLVHSAALRRVGDTHLAEEIAQAVFVILARKAAALGPGTILPGWLHRTTRYAAADVLKQNRRRQAREQEAHMQSLLLATQPDADETWKQIAPFLEEAVDALDDPDRDAVVLRYFQNKTLAQVGAALGVSEDAARMRINRALEQLRTLFIKRGATIAATAIGGAVAANAIKAAPVGLAAKISAGVLTGTITAATATTTASTAAMTTIQKIAVTAALAAVTAAGAYEARQATTASAEARVLQQQQAPLTAQLQQLQRDLAASTNQLADLQAENARLKSDSDQMELLKLRGQVSALQQQNAQFAAGGGGGPALSSRAKTTYSSFDLPSEHPGDETNNGVVNLDGVDVAEVLNMYGSLSKRTVVHGALPQAQIFLKTSAPMSRIQLLQQLDTTLAENGIAMVLSGDDAVKAVPANEAPGENPPEITLPWRLLPDSSSPMTRTVHVKNYRPTETIPLLSPYSKLHNSLIFSDDQNTITFRDYSSSVKQELKLLESLDQKPDK